MVGTVHVLHPQAAPVAGFLRIGYTGHRKLEAMLAAGRFPYRRVVFEAAHITEQDDLMKSSAATQRRRQLDDLSSVPELRRAGHFIKHQVYPAVRSARKGVRLKIADEKVVKAISDAKGRLVRLWEAMDDLHDSEKLATRSQSPEFRGNGRTINSVLERK